MTYRIICPFCKNNDSEGFRIHFASCAQKIAETIYVMSIRLECMVCHELVNDWFSDWHPKVQELAENIGFVDKEDNLIEPFPKIYGVGMAFSVYPEKPKPQKNALIQESAGENEKTENETPKKGV